MISSKPIYGIFPHKVFDQHTVEFILGFRFLRALRLLNLPDILQYLNILRTNSHIKIARLLSRVLAFWLTSAGLVHLVRLFLFTDEIDFVFKM